MAEANHRSRIVLQGACKAPRDTLFARGCGSVQLMNDTPEAAVLTLNATLAIALAWFGEASFGITLSGVAASFLGGALIGRLGTRVRAPWAGGRRPEAVPSSLGHRLDDALPIVHAVAVLALAALTSPEVAAVVAAIFAGDAWSNLQRVSASHKRP